MELKDLKSAWDTYSSQEVDKHRLGKENIHSLLKNRTKSLMDRIDRNIRIGMIILLVFIGYILADDFFFSKILITAPIEYPGWLVPIDVFTNVLIITTYLFFVLRYFRIKRNFSADTQLKDLLSGILETLQTYRRMFYLAVIILLLNMVVSFTAGLYQGIKLNADSLSGGMESLTMSKVLIIIGIGLAFLIPLIAGTFLFLRWGFNKLYGRYLIKLNETLLELDESGNIEL
ncbi:MAG: hypothetical protein Q8S54_12850 [Bacteroidota bacterium]|nr:hypothetical protein [Odoribacter sp.]MDP3644067.1 hypothetical protein [Bacteroidota bacterium]